VDFLWSHLFIDLYTNQFLMIIIIIYNDSEEARQTIPRLGLEDLEPKAVELPLTVVQDGKSDNGDGLTILAHEVPSNGILYFDLALDYSDISADELPYLGLFSRMVLESGTSKLDSVALSRKIGTETGGISTSYYSDVKHKSGVIVDPDDVLLYFMVRGKAVYDKIDNLLDLVTEVLFDANLSNQKRAVEMLKESKVRKQSSVISSGHTYAASRMSSKRTFLGHLGEVTGGLTSVRDAGKILDQAEKDWPAVQKHLQKIRDTLLKRNSAVINLTADARTLQAAQIAVNSLVKRLPKNPSTIPMAESPLLKSWHKIKQEIDSKPRVNEGFVMPSQVNYVGKSASIYKPGEPISSATTVVARYLSTGYLWDNVRVVGGAYGGFARFSESSGNMVYLSYRDPNLYKTLQIYDAAADNLLNSEVHTEDILQAVVGAVGDLDSPLSPDQKGFASMCQYLVGESAEDRQKSRDQVLGTSASDFKTFAERLKKVETDGISVVFGSQAALDQANAEIQDVTQKFNLEPAFTDTP